MKKYLAALFPALLSVCAPTPGIVSYHPHMPVETQRQIAEGALRQLLPIVCGEYEFESPEKIECRQSLQVLYRGRPTGETQETHSDLSCSQIDGIHSFSGFLGAPGRIVAVLRGDCDPMRKMGYGAVPFAVGDKRSYGKCRDNIAWHVDRREKLRAVGRQGDFVDEILARDFYEALYAYCTSHGYPIQLYGSPEKLFGY